jgi:hypothetical protein
MSAIFLIAFFKPSRKQVLPVLGEPQMTTLAVAFSATVYSKIEPVL